MIGWDRKPVMHKDSVKLAIPVTYPLGDRPIAKLDRPATPRKLPRQAKIVGLLTDATRTESTALLP